MLELLDIGLKDIYFFVFVVEYAVDFFCCGSVHQKKYK
jgi:hypothetical protein